MSDRGMKKWNAYKALPEQFEELNKTSEEARNVDKPILAEDRIEEINSVLVNFHGQTLNVTYYKNRRILKETASIKKIDINNKKIILSTGTNIPFENIINLE